MRRDLKHMPIVAIVSQKGGCAKSTLAIHLAVEAVRKRKLRTVILELDKQGTTGLLWNQRRAENHAPDDLVKAMGDATPPQPEVHRVDSSNIQVVLEEMRRGGVEFIVLDLPGAHNPAVAKAIAASDYILIPSRPNDIDVHASLETVDIARRLKKPFAYVFTFVPPTGQDEPKMREALEDAGLTVAPKGLGDRRKEYAEAIASGSTVQETKPGSMSAAEVKAIWRWLEQQLEATHDRKAAH
jgi:chromosome partitioning protein